MEPVDPKELRRMKIFAELTDEQLARLAGWVEPVQFPPNRVIVHIGAHGDCMYLILSGEVLVSVPEDKRDIALTQLETGDFFGDVCLFDEGPRSADVVAKTECRLIKLSKTNFETMLNEDPAMAARILVATIRHVESRVRRLTNRYVDSMLLSRSWNALLPRK